MEFSKQDLGARYTDAIGKCVVPRPSHWAELGNMCLCTFTFISTSIVTSVSIYTYWKIWVHTETSLLIQHQKIYSTFLNPFSDRRNLVTIIFNMFTYWVNSFVSNQSPIICVHFIDALITLPSVHDPIGWTNATGSSKIPILIGLT